MTPGRGEPICSSANLLFFMSAILPVDGLALVRREGRSFAPTQGKKAARPLSCEVR
jgi:hypothetical protein